MKLELRFSSTGFDYIFESLSVCVFTTALLY